MSTSSSSKVLDDNVVSNDYPVNPVDQQLPSNSSYNSSAEGLDYDYDIDESFSRYLLSNLSLQVLHLFDTFLALIGQNLVQA